MKHLKLYEQFDENDPFGEEIEYVKPTFLSWLRNKYPDENTWSEITRIDCYNNQLTSLEGIENLVNLKILDCNSNQLTSLEGIENLVNLKVLSCSNNQLTNMEIENLVNLKGLNCYHNQLTSLEGIENMAKLVRLSCYQNQFTIEYKDYLKNYCKKKNINLTI